MVIGIGPLLLSELIKGILRRIMPGNVWLKALLLAGGRVIYIKPVTTRNLSLWIWQSDLTRPSNKSNLPANTGSARRQFGRILRSTYQRDGIYSACRASSIRENPQFVKLAGLCYTTSNLNGNCFTQRKASNESGAINLRATPEKIEDRCRHSLL